MLISCVQRAGALLLIALLTLPAWAQDVSSTLEESKPEPMTYYGLLPTRDLSLFGFLRLDMRPTYAVSDTPDNWAEIELGYQNTWALSENVKHYLNTLEGRRSLGPTEIQAIRDLPGEAYLVDLEMGLLDVTLHHKFTDHLGGYTTLSGVFYTGGFLDGGIEWFHNSFGLPDASRPAVSRNDINVIFDLKSSQLNQPSLPNSGLLDPIFGLRYMASLSPTSWNLVIEGAVKVPIDGERPFLSTGYFDYGTQITMQRFQHHHAAYASVAAVYTQPSNILPTSAHIIPTFILGYEHRLTVRTNVNAQFYASPSVFKYSDTDLDELLENKYQLSLGLRHRIHTSVLTFGVTEDLANFGDSPDFGLQLNWSYMPSSTQ